jgi:cardiolipin synthase A/B
MHRILTGMSTTALKAYQWLPTGDQAFAAMLAAIEAARLSVRLETYIFAAGALGDRFREALLRACQRGVRVQVLLDAWGSFYLASDYWQSLVQAGGSFRWFNPISLNRFGFRDHRKLLVCDEGTAFVGGFNLAPEYEGDGVHRGWRDVGLLVEGPLCLELAGAFDALFAQADFQHPRFMRWRRPAIRKTVDLWQDQLLLSGPGRGRDTLKRMVASDLARARTASIMTAYFLPTWRIRHELQCMARRGGCVQLLLAGKSDVAVAQLASRRLYQPLLKSGIEIFEYQPQILHAKMLVLDDTVYVGSANLDIRSLRINYDLFLRLTEPQMAEEARSIFADALSQSRRVDPQQWMHSRGFWEKLKERWAFFLLARVDPFLAKRQLRHLR